jgi:hypothetical protein
MTFEAFKARIMAQDRRLGFRVSIMALIEESPVKLILGVSTRQQSLKRLCKETELLDCVRSYLDEGQALEIVYDFDKNKRRRSSIGNWFLMK